ncbi:hypothetical protein [Sphingomonas koreensis]
MAEPTRQETADDAKYLDRVRDDSRIRDLERENAILAAKQEISEAAHGRLEVIIAAFGVVIAISAIAFGLVTKDAAVAAASRGIEQERLSIREISLDIQNRREEVQELAAVVERHHLEMENQSAIIFDKILQESLLSKPGTYAPNISIFDRSAVISVGSRIESNQGLRSNPIHYQILMALAMIDGKWSRAKIFAVEYREKFPGDFCSVSYADFVEVLAMASADQIPEARTLCVDSVGRYPPTSDASVIRNVARLTYFRALIERSSNLSRIPTMDEVAILRDIVRVYGSIDKDDHIGEIVHLAQSRLEQIDSVDLREVIAPFEG